MFDYLFVPAVFLYAGLALTLSAKSTLPSLVVTSAIVAGAALAAALLERLRPERRAYVPFDRSLLEESAHFLFNYQLGYALAALICIPLPSLPIWPAQWPFAAQVLLAVVMSEALSYWQHRLYHTIPWAWRFHALHHSGERLNLVRAGRFHFVDVGMGAITTFAPMILCGTPDSVIRWVVCLSGVAGVLQHTNVRMRTPRWLDWLICTPAVHRSHHSNKVAESNRNFGTTVMLFDWLWGSYTPPRADGPDAVGIVGDKLPRGFWAAFMAPLRRGG